MYIVTVKMPDSEAQGYYHGVIQERVRKALEDAGIRWEHIATAYENDVEK